MARMALNDDFSNPKLSSASVVVNNFVKGIPQCVLLALDSLDHRKGDPLGWSAVAVKK